MRALYDEHAGPLLRYALHLTGGDRQHAEDIAQETLLRTWVHPEAIAERLARQARRDAAQVVLSARPVTGRRVPYPSRRLAPCARSAAVSRGAREEGEDFADGGFLAGGFG